MSKGSSFPAVHSAHGSPITSLFLPPGHSLDSLECEPDLHFTRASYHVGHSWIIVDREVLITESKQIAVINNEFQISSNLLGLCSSGLTIMTFPLLQFVSSKLGKLNLWH